MAFWKSELVQAREAAKAAGVTFGKFTTSKDSQGEYTLYEDGRIVGEGYFESASDIKTDYIINSLK